MDIEQIKSSLRNFKQRKCKFQEGDEVRNYFKEIKKEFVIQNKQEEAKEVWCLEQVLEIQENFLKAYALLKQDDFYKAWCLFEECELTSDSLRPHFRNCYGEYCLNFIDEQVKQYQSLYPYKIFMSPELLDIEMKCNICGKTVEIRKLCGHEVGEIYNGDMCVRDVTKVDFLGSAFVESPLQKYSIPFMVDKKSNKSVDNYDYRLLKYLVSKLKSPFVDWKVTWMEKLHSHSRFNNLGRNEKCPCGSGKKYKKCCLPKAGVLMPHAIFKIPGMELGEERIFS